MLPHTISGMRLKKVLARSPSIMTEIIAGENKTSECRVKEECLANLLVAVSVDYTLESVTLRISAKTLVEASVSITDCADHARGSDSPSDKLVHIGFRS